jgi:hypothetical protein
VDRRERADEGRRRELDSEFSARLANGSAAQLRATAPPRPDRSDHVRRQILSETDWNALWLVSCSGLLGGLSLQACGLVRLETPAEMGAARLVCPAVLP